VPIADSRWPIAHTPGTNLDRESITGEPPVAVHHSSVVSHRSEKLEPLGRPHRPLPATGDSLLFVGDRVTGWLGVGVTGDNESNRGHLVSLLILDRSQFNKREPDTLLPRHPDARAPC
jgi:hypothetical protein